MSPEETTMPERFATQSVPARRPRWTRRAPVLVAALLLAGCSGGSGDNQAPSPEQSPTTPAAASATATPSDATGSDAAEPGISAFCDYLTQLESTPPEDQAELLEQIATLDDLAPEGFAEDLALFRESREKFDIAIGGGQGAAQAQQWLEENNAAVNEAAEKLNTFTEKNCGAPLITTNEG